MPNELDRRKLHPVSMRISDMQYVALKKLRNATGLALQEHIRRAIDDYIERQRVKSRRAA
jgi:predicted DNA binding CopG/RHH family protein